MVTTMSENQSTEALLEELSDFCSGFPSENGLREIIERYGCAPNPRIYCFYDNYKFFFEACCNKKVTEEILRLLLEYFPDAVRPVSRLGGATPLHWMCTNKTITLGMVQLLIYAYPESLRRGDNHGNMPLYFLCFNKSLNEEVGLEILNYFIERCPESVRHADNSGNLSIHAAAMCQSPEFCRLLVEAYPGSERITNDRGLLPFHRACQENNVATAKYFLNFTPKAQGC